MLKIEEVVDNVTGYIESRVEVIKLDIKDQATSIGVDTLVWAIVGFFGLMALLFLSMAAGFWLGRQLESLPLGFVLVAVFYVAVGGALLLSREKLQRAVAKKVFPNYKHPVD
jgi:Putative Actinobacterial Holin-X, holin superfamily III